jgi:sporulation protein YtfJ
MSKLKNIVEVDTIVGNPIKIDGEKILVPVAKVSMGFIAGGGEYGAQERDLKITQNFPFAGGSGAGVCVSPIGFICYDGDDEVKYIKVEDVSIFEKLLVDLPEIVKGLINNDKE